MLFFRSGLLLVAGLAAFTLIAPVAGLLVVQHGLIYHPRPYQGSEAVGLGQVVDLAFRTSQGAQHCYYVPPPTEVGGRRPDRIWVVFSGNASRALDWLHFVQSYPSARDACLLVDYPGYGACAGRASPESIQESADASLNSLAAHLGTTSAALEPRLAVLGHSLGAAVALQFASVHPVSRIVLIAPFTSLREMAQRVVGWPLCYALIGNFDNRERLRQITRRSPAPRITILFGKEDEEIPFAMGQELARLFPQVDFEPMEGVGHNSILFKAKDRIFAAMMASVR
jgi:pimeloyl-ACP methyl ester carboxylesterase